MKKKSIIIGLSLSLCLFAFLIRDWFLSFFVAEITGENILFSHSSSLTHRIFPMLIFIFSFGIIPFLYLIVKNYCKIYSVKQKLLSLLIIIISGVLLSGLRVIYLKFKVAQINDILRRAEFTSEADIPRIHFQDMYLEYYLLAGLIVGALLSMIIFKKSSNIGIKN